MDSSQTPIEQIDLGKNFQLTKRLGSGAFGEIFHAINLKNSLEVAIKIEPITTKNPQIFYETNIYKYLLQDSSVLDKGIPQVYYCSSKGKYNMMVMDLLGPSLEDLFTNCGRKFSLKTVLLIAHQSIQCIEYTHSRTFLHRDIKPDNFLIGYGKRKHKIYIIDFGLAKRYITKEGKHIPYKDQKNLTGTARYASINTHIGIEQARRDDLESLGYVLMYFLRGSLPWQNLRAKNKKDKYEKIQEKKIETTPETLCKGFPQEFTQYLKYCRNLKFEEKPDYEYLKGMFKELSQKMGYEYDYKYDWNPILEKNEAENEKAKQALPQEPKK